MRTREAIADDVDAIVELAAALFAEDGGTRDAYADPGWPRRDGRPYYAGAVDEVGALVMVAEEATAVGFLVGRLHAHDPLRPAAAVAELESMFIRPASRSRGAGRALAGAFHRWAAEHGANLTAVTAHAGNAGALRLYRALGYGDHTVTLQRPVNAPGTAARRPASPSRTHRGRRW